MSYDLFVFDPKAAPKDHEAFIDWATAEMEREDGVTAGDPARTSSGLRAWFLGMIPHFPAMNGPFAPEQLPDDQDTLTDYIITAGSISSTTEEGLPSHISSDGRTCWSDCAGRRGGLGRAFSAWV